MSVSHDMDLIDRNTSWTIYKSKLFLHLKLKPQLNPQFSHVSTDFWNHQDSRVLLFTAEDNVDSFAFKGQYRINVKEYRVYTSVNIKIIIVSNP